MPCKLALFCRLMVVCWLILFDVVGCEFAVAGGCSVVGRIYWLASGCELYY